MDEQFLDRAADMVRQALERMLSPEAIIRAARADVDADLGPTPGGDRPVPPPEDIPRLIDHTLLRPQARPYEIERVCLQARQFGFASVCVNPRFVPLAARLLESSSVRVSAVIGFPLGAAGPLGKAFEAALAVAQAQPNSTW